MDTKTQTQQLNIIHFGTDGCFVHPCPGIISPGFGAKLCSYDSREVAVCTSIRKLITDDKTLVEKGLFPCGIKLPIKLRDFPEVWKKIGTKWIKRFPNCGCDDIAILPVHYLGDRETLSNFQLRHSYDNLHMRFLMPAGYRYIVWKKIMLSIITSIRELHKYDIYHLDIHGGNIMIADDYSTALIDFGHSFHMKETAEVYSTIYWIRNAPHYAIPPDLASGLISEHEYGYGAANYAKLYKLYQRSGRLLTADVKHDKKYIAEIFRSIDEWMMYIRVAIPSFLRFNLLADYPGHFRLLLAGLRFTHRLSLENLESALISPHLAAEFVPAPSCLDYDYLRVFSDQCEFDTISDTAFANFIARAARCQEPKSLQALNLAGCPKSPPKSRELITRWLSMSPSEQMRYLIE